MVAIHEKRVRRCLSRVKGELSISCSLKIYSYDNIIPTFDGVCRFTGIEKVEVEASIQKVVITGYVHRNKIIKALRRVGLRAEFWSQQNEILSAYASGSLMINNFSFF